MSVWERFESIATPSEVNEAKNQFSPIEAGTYKCILEELAPAESKDGLPMLKGKFRMVENNRILFYNQMLQNLSYPNMTAVNIAEAVSFVGSLLGEQIDFTGLSAFAKVVENVPVGTEYGIDVSYGGKDVDKKFPKLKVVKIATGNEEFMSIPDGITEDLPFN